MIVASFGSYPAISGHDHEVACSPAPGTARFTPAVAPSM